MTMPFADVHSAPLNTVPAYIRPDLRLRSRAKPRVRQAGGSPVALAHDYFFIRGGAERVFDQFLQLYPGAPVFTSAVSPHALSTYARAASIRTSYLQHVPRIGEAYRFYLPFYAHAFSRLHLHDYPLVVASSSAFAHTLNVTGGKLVVYCHTPPRFLWQPQHYLEYERGVRIRAARTFSKPLLHVLKRRDYAAAQRVDLFIANSQTVARRIEAFYGRAAAVVPPSVEVERFAPLEQQSFALAVSRLQPYKRLDLAIDACARVGIPLIIAGDGPARSALHARATANTTFLGWVDDERVSELMGSARLFLVPGEQDFGLTTIEANAAGCPVVAFARGGSVETVLHGRTGVLFEDQTVEGVSAAIEDALSRTWNRNSMVEHARFYDTSAFRQRFCDVLSTHEIKVAPTDPTTC